MGDGDAGKTGDRDRVVVDDRTEAPLLRSIERDTRSYGGRASSVRCDYKM
jgi:hypothetical protein